MSDLMSKCHDMWKEDMSRGRTTRGDDMQAPAVPGDYTTGGVVDHFRDAGKMVGEGHNSRGAILLEAHRIINGERQQQYGSPEDSHAVIAELWSGYMHARSCCGHNVDLYPHDVAHMMVLFKIGRQLNGAGKLDNYVDAAGYLGIAADIQDSRTQEVGDDR